MVGVDHTLQRLATGRAAPAQTATAEQPRAHRTAVASGFIASEPTAKFASARSLAQLKHCSHKMEPSPDVHAAVVMATKALDTVEEARTQAWLAVKTAATAAGCATRDLFGHKVNIDAATKRPAHRRITGARQGGDGLEAASGRRLYVEKTRSHQKT